MQTCASPQVPRCFTHLVCGGLLPLTHPQRTRIHRPAPSWSDLPCNLVSDAATGPNWTAAIASRIQSRNRQKSTADVCTCSFWSLPLTHPQRTCRDCLAPSSLHIRVRRRNWRQISPCHSQQDAIKRQTDSLLYLQFLELALQLLHHRCLCCSRLGSCHQGCYAVGVPCSECPLQTANGKGFLVVLGLADHSVIYKDGQETHGHLVASIAHLGQRHHQSGTWGGRRS